MTAENAELAKSYRVHATITPRELHDPGFTAPRMTYGPSMRYHPRMRRGVNAGRVSFLGGGLRPPSEPPRDGAGKAGAGPSKGASAAPSEPPPESHCAGKAGARTVRLH